AAITAALDGYVRAHEAHLASEFAARNGLNLPEGVADVEAQALVLRALVAALPELAPVAPSDRADALEAVETTSLAPGRPSEPRSPPRRETMEILTVEEAQRSLASDFDAAAFNAMRLEEFLLYADEFAARARALQERTGGDPLSLRVIRRLTALV